MASARHAYRPGQVWSYRTRDHEPRSRAGIVRVDELEDGRAIYHLSVDGLAMTNPDGPDEHQRTLAHIPVSLETLEASLTARRPEPLDEIDGLAGFEEGYALWHEDFERDEAGFFVAPLAEIVQDVEDTLNGLAERD